MADIKCACEGLKKLSKALDVYVLFDAGISSYKSKAKESAMELHEHIRRQANKAGNEALRASVQPLLDKEQQSINNIDHGLGGPMEALDRVRDDIHKSDDVKQLLVCGGPYKNADDLDDTAKVVKIVMEMMAAEGPPYLTIRELANQAKQPLDALVGQLQCDAM